MAPALDVRTRQFPAALQSPLGPPQLGGSHRLQCPLFPAYSTQRHASAPSSETNVSGVDEPESRGGGGGSLSTAAVLSGGAVALSST